jgi:hypothetical protein
MKFRRRAFDDDDAAYIRGWWYGGASITDLCDWCHCDRRVIYDIVYHEGAYK